jgi:hypothetical protein
LYQWQATPADAGSVDLQTECPAFPPPPGGFVAADTALAGYFAALCRLRPSSFVLKSWGGHRHTVVIAFGFPPDSPDVCIPVDASGVIQLAALAAWCVYEIGRLRGEISVVSDRLGGRRLVEQAKQRLQEDQGLGEPAAYAYMRKLSRQRRIRMAEIARELLSSSGLAPIDAPP